MDPPRGWKEVKALFGDPTWRELSGGNVDLDDGWEAANLVVIPNVAGLGLTLRCHHLVREEIIAALLAARAAAPKYRVRLLGCYSPRHQRHDAALPLSLHSWGCALDVNWDRNPMGPKLVTDLPAPFIAAFTRRGWVWGGTFKSVKDAMHFQFARGV